MRRLILPVAAVILATLLQGKGLPTAWAQAPVGTMTPADPPPGT